MGIVLPAAEGVSAWAAHTYHYYASLADTFEFEKSMPQQSGQFVLLVREAVGVVAAIILWTPRRRSSPEPDPEDRRQS
jgi:acyl-CoA reductase-like NAD-dependent aldehyde dehydrogenase